jgi:hypothetical protein
MLSQVIKVVEPSAVFKPIKWSDQTEKIKTPDAGLILKLFAERTKQAKHEEIRKCAQNWCLK